MKVSERTLGLAAAGVISFGNVRPVASVPVEVLRLKQRLESEWSTVKLSVEAPDDTENGIWHIDFTIGVRTHVIGYKKGKPLGFASDAALKDLVFGEGWPEVFNSVEEILARIARL